MWGLIILVIIAVIVFAVFLVVKSLTRHWGVRGFMLGLVLSLCALLIPFKDYYYGPLAFDEYVQQNKGKGINKSYHVDGYLIDRYGYLFDPAKKRVSNSLVAFKFERLFTDKYKFIETYIKDHENNEFVYINVSIGTDLDCQKNKEAFSSQSKLVKFILTKFHKDFVRKYEVCPIVGISKKPRSLFAYVDHEYLTGVVYKELKISGGKSYIYQVETGEVVAEQKWFKSYSWINRKFSGPNVSTATWHYSDPKLYNEFTSVLIPNI
jgi:hypothetical protein